MFEFLFNYPRTLWDKAELVFTANWPPIVWVALVAVFLLLLSVMLFRQNLSFGRKLTVGALQVISAAAVVLMLWQPELHVEEVSPGDNTIAYLLDNSGSMYFADSNDAVNRIDGVRNALTTTAQSLESTFTRSLFAAGESLEPIDSFDELPVPSERTAISDALLSLVGNINNQSLAAIVLASDGADNTGTLTSEWWQRIKAAGVPVHTVGVGPLTLEKDLELTDVSLVERAAPKTKVAALLRIKHGFGGPVRVRVHAGANLLHAEDVELDGNLSETVVAIEFDSGEPGIYELRFSITAGDISERNTLNNQQPRILEVAYRPQRILYVEGEPRWEYKFLRRALTDHQELAIVSLLRTSPNKYYRQGVIDENELEDGFPKNRDELFRYDAIIIGSLEAAQLTASQQAHLRDFVAVRGGSLLMIAGRDGLGDGGWGRSAISDALPVRLSSRTDVKTYLREPASALITQQGLRTDWMRLAIDDAENIKAWQDLPPLSDFQKVESPKPGSVVALTALSEQGSSPLLIWQRYGKGHSYVLATSGTWRWQMRLPSDDQRHEIFWQNLTQQLTATALPRITFEQKSKVLRDMDSLALSVVARDKNFNPLEQSELQAQLTRPDGSESWISLRPDLSVPGRYRAAIPLKTSGPFKVSFDSAPAGEVGFTINGALNETWWIKEAGTAEYFNSVQNQQFLKRLSAETNGQYLALAEISTLEDLLKQDNAAQRNRVQLPLWNMPILFIVLLLAKGTEWLLRLSWKRL